MTRTIQGYYGGSKTACDVYVYDKRNGTSWYAAEGSVNVNLSNTEQLTDGVWIEELRDFDTFTWSKGINSEEELEEAVEA